MGTGVQNISFLPQYPQTQGPGDFVSQQAQIQRQQKLAEALQQQSDQDIPIQSYNGTQAPIPMTAILAKALQKISGNIQAGRAATAQRDLTKSEQDAAQKAISYFLCRERKIFRM